jgi:hypothetical protein
VKRKLIITISTCAALAVGTLAYSQFRLSRRVSEDSAQRALLVELGQSLDAHYESHKSYPRSLAEVPAHSWPDGSSPATLRSFRFESDGASFTLSCTSAYDGRVFTVQR